MGPDLTQHTIEEEMTNIPISDQENAFSQGYKKALDDLLNKGWNPRKAKRYLDSIAKRNMKKFMKRSFKNKDLPKIDIDPIAE